MDIRLNTDRADTAYVHNDRNELVRITPLRADEFARLHIHGRTVPAGMTRNEWEAQNASAVAGEQWQPGCVYERPDGSIRILIAREIIDGKLVESIVHFERDEWSGQIPRVSVPDAVVAAMVHGSQYTVLAVRNGVLTVA